MTRVLLGALLGAGLLATVAYVWMRGAEGCLGRCGNGTHCDDHKCVATADARPANGPQPKERRRRAHHGQNDPLAPPEVQLRPGDEKMVAQGDSLGRPERIDLSQGDDAKELPEEELERVFKTGQPAILRCVTDALGDAPLETGKVEVGFRVEKTGQVSRVRVEGPALLQRQGLTRCVRAVMTSLTFPRSGGSSVMTHSFELK